MVRFAVTLYKRFPLLLGIVEDLQHERRIDVSGENAYIEYCFPTKPKKRAASTFLGMVGLDPAVHVVKN